jgi:integrase
VLLAAWTGLRYGELAELRRRDLDLAHGVIRVRRAVVWVNSEPIIMTPKSTAGSRDVSIPPHILPTIREHLLRFGIASDQLLFPAAKTDTHLRSGTLTAIWVRARKEVGRPGLRFHDLRHTHAVWVAGEGATLAELMARLGHSSPGAAMRYQHAAKGRDAQIAAALSRLAEQT